MKNGFEGYVIDRNGELCDLSLDSDGYTIEHNTDANTRSLFFKYPFKDVIILGSDWASIDKELLKKHWRNYSKYNA